MNDRFRKPLLAPAVACGSAVSRPAAVGTMMVGACRNLPAANASRRLGRRAFVRDGSLFLLGATATSLRAADDRVGAVRVGLVTDLHYADKPSRGMRHYRETLVKLAEAGKRFATDKPDFIVELGDFIDAADSVAAEQNHLRQVIAVFDTLPGPKHYVLGNHCVETLTKDEFLGGVGGQESFYSFDVGGCHFVVLDSCFRGDGRPHGRKNATWDDANVPGHELEWLAADLERTDKQVVVFAHQRLDESGKHAVKNAAEVRRTFESAGNVLAVFQGHSHANDYQQIAGIHYTTLVAMVEGSGAENNGYAMLDVLGDGSLRLKGFHRQMNRDFSHA